MAYISSTGIPRQLAFATMALLLQPAIAQQDGSDVPSRPLLLDHDPDLKSSAAPAADRHSPVETAADTHAAPERREIVFGGYRDWEVGVGTRRSVGVMIKRDFR